MTRKRALLWLLAVTALALFFRLWHFGSVPPGLYSDEAMNGNNALEALQTGNYKVFYPENNGREGLFINIQAIFLKFLTPLREGNAEPWMLRLPSALFGIFTVLGVYFLTAELFKNIRRGRNIVSPERIALFAAFLLATSFWHINFSRIGFRAIMAPFFLVWSFWLLWKSLEFGNSVSKRTWKRSFQAIISGLLFGLGFHSYIAYRVAPVLLIFPLLAILKKPRPRKKALAVFALFLVSAFLAALPLGLYFLKNPADFLGRTSQISIFESENPVLNLFKNIFLTLQMFFFVGDFNWRHNFAGSPLLWLPVAILFLAGLLTALKKTIKSPAGPESFLMVWFLAGLLPVIVSNEGLPHALRAIIVAPAVMILAALGLEIILKKLPKGRTVALTLAVLFLSISGYAFYKYFVKWATNENVSRAFNQNLKEIAEDLKKTPKETPKYVIMRGTESFDYRGSPMSAQPIMFITGTFLPQWQKDKNFFYLPAKEAANIPEKAKTVWID